MVTTKTKRRIKKDSDKKRSIEPELFWTASAFLLLILGYYTWRVCSTLQINYDLGLIALGADWISNGGLLYSDIHTVMFPGAYLILASFFKLFGSSFFVCQIATTISVLAVGGLTLTLSRKFINGWLAMLPATITVVVGAYMNPYFSHHWCSVFFFLAFTNLLVHFGTQPKSFTKLSLYYTGIAGGLTVLCYQLQLIPIILCSIIAGFVFAKKQQAGEKSPDSEINENKMNVSTTIILLLTGITTVPTLLVIGLVATGAFNDFIDCTIKFVLSNYSEVNKVTYGWNNTQESVISLFRFPLNLCSNMIFGILNWAPAIVLIGSLFTCIKEGSLSKVVSKYPQIVLLVSLAFGLLFGEALHKPDLRRLVWGMPIMLIAVFYFAERVSEKFKSAKILIYGASIMLTTGLLFSGKLFLLEKTIFAKEYSSNRGIVSSITNLEILEKTKNLIAPGEKVLVYPYDTAIAYLTSGKHPSKYPVLHYRYHTKEQFQSVIDDMEISKVRYVIWNRLFDNSNYRELGWPNYKRVPNDELIIEPYLREKYKPVKMYGNYLLMKRKKTGKD